MLWRDVITSVARHMHTPVDVVEEWDIDKLIDYSASLNRVVRAEAPKKGRG